MKKQRQPNHSRRYGPVIKRKLKEQDIIRIFKCHKAGESISDIAAKYNVDETKIQDILDRVEFAHIPIPARLR